jgi:hypothetical protein
MRVFVSFLPMIGMVVFVCPMVALVRVSVLGTGVVAVSVCVHVAVFMGVFVAMFVGVGFAAVNMLVGMDVCMSVVMRMFVFVCSFHGVASSRLFSTGIIASYQQGMHGEGIIQVIAMAWKVSATSRARFPVSHASYGMK